MEPFGSRVINALEEGPDATWALPEICVALLPEDFGVVDFPDSGEHAARPAAVATATEK